MAGTNLYGRLFRYRSRENRAPLEDYLTEALADLLERVPVQDQAKLIGNILGSERVWQKAFANHRHSWRTQVACGGGFADLVLELDGKAAVVIESKLYSGVRSHGTRGNQLTTYGLWLAQIRDEALPSGLILLTHGTEPPTDMMTEPEYGVEARAVLRWSELARWLSREGAVSDGSVWRSLARDLHSFLEAKAMTNDTITGSDVAAARLFLPGWTRWENTFRLLWSGADEVRTGFLSSKTSALSMAGDGGMLWQWSYAASPLPDSSWVAFALRFPDASDWYSGAGLPELPHLMLIIGADRSDLPVERIGSAPDGWLVHEAEVMKALPLHELPAELDAQAAAMGAWARRSILEARDILVLLKS